MPTNPRSDAQIAPFWDKRAERYAKSDIADMAAYEHKLKATQALLQPSMRLLEFGCGTGMTALKHAPHVAAIHATDVSSGMLGIARRNAEASGITNVTFEQASIETLRVDSPFDVVLGLNILHLVHEPAAAIRKVAEFLKPGGWFISSTPCLGYSWLFRVLIPTLRMIGLAPPVHLLTPEALKQALTDAGFVIEQEWQPKPRQGLFLIARKGGD